MQAGELLSALAELIKAGCGHLSETIMDAQFDGTSRDAALVIVTKDEQDGHQEWLLSSRDVEDLTELIPPIEEYFDE